MEGRESTLATHFSSKLHMKMFANTGPRLASYVRVGLVADEQSQERDLTTGAAIMRMFVSNKSKLLESTYTFDRRSNITKQQRSSEALKLYP